MPIIRCGAANCTYNHLSNCMKNGIAVEGQHATRTSDTMCESFSYSDTKKNYNYELADFDNRKTTSDVWCDAMLCKHIVNGKCRAKDIRIGGLAAKKSTETCCDTFIKE